MLRSTIFIRWMLALMLLFCISGCGQSQLEFTMEYSSELSAQMKGYRSIYQGRVVDRSSKEPIPNARVYILHDRMYGSRAEAFTDAHGSFTTTVKLFYNEIKITADGYKPYEGIWNLCP
ncbi:carboxypeptidase-like regulatory domain-containing protein [Herpetosiphon giganteus]|uniref:carboxypeptidase-like regulatory domain-containing protein n=1 Tax=Herpetosiphon giganteus TaxID=2029754 RepID=UPI00195DBB63|nr:carboxypeptidase-like regulatory domain-containing protein [Herpetosiphon giganteus]MBM7843043.1 hypothetical protein [Herpetosiphon giganteus]